ncbi:MAG: hypothetical protein Q9M37_09220, partial [Desulfonauticus sp.]|nr:hypothetical protein [Desulfonauticus sp.]
VVGPRQDKARHEVDFIIDKRIFQIAIEAKFKTKLKPMDLRGVKAFRKDYPESKIFLVTLSLQETNDISYILPFSFTCTLFKDLDKLEIFNTEY